MFETLSFAELEAQDVEILPARTVLSMLVLLDTNNTCTHHSCNTNTANAGNSNVTAQIQNGTAFGAGGLGGNANVWQLQANQTWQSAIAKAR